MMMSCQHPEHGICTGGVVPGESSQPEHTTCTGDFVCLLDSQSNHAIFGAINKIHYWQHRNSPRWIPYKNEVYQELLRIVISFSDSVFHSFVVVFHSVASLKWHRQHVLDCHEIWKIASHSDCFHRQIVG